MPFAVNADPWKDESGHGRRDSREYKEEYWEGNCKIKREFKKDGEYEEKRKCEAPRHRQYDRAPVYRSGAPAIIIDPMIRIGIGRE
ncbi:hypothetical protein CR155_06095 [Pollutimonas nitritireducens]|uniref:Uncharacterized protein n=1 Tax=Pollutimonas nitritireducens TaxID=2045209 RepID=A0A2N4UJ38_9BURK|nr:hypothetical protein CR155_06095 [Pollutimonas nitritireducens]